MILDRVDLDKYYYAPRVTKAHDRILSEKSDSDGQASDTRYVGVPTALLQERAVEAMFLHRCFLPTLRVSN